MNTGTTTSTNTVTWTITYYGCSPVPPKKLSYKERRKLAVEQRRRERARLWLENCKKRADAYFEEEMRKIRAWSKANAWRPRVSSQGTGWGLTYWSLSCHYEEDPEVPEWRARYNRYYKRGWLGITINNPSHAEQRMVDAILAKIPKKNKLIEYKKSGGWKPYEDGDQHRRDGVGHFQTVHMEVWFAKLEDHNEVVAALDASPKLTHFMSLKDDRNLPAVRKLLNQAKANYRVARGDEGIGIFMTDQGDTMMVMLRLFGSEIEPI